MTYSSNVSVVIRFQVCIFDILNTAMAKEIGETELL